ncbi:MAG: hypothetical protein GEU74_13050 [Nitriliruptorales bacterium]|nr:hypothetical protein [Nitriliruptorales bacterium]
MFVQFITGRAKDAQALQARFDDWTQNLKGGAHGWRGTTAGVAEDGTFVAAVRFESPEAAQRNSDRPEQGEWWAQTEPLIEAAEFTDSADVIELLGGADPAARFVQVMRGRVLDAAAAAEMMDGMEDGIRRTRPDVTGLLVATHGDRFTQVVYFTDEAAARAGESQDRPEDADMEAMARVFTDVTYVDLKAPWHAAS